MLERIVFRGPEGPLFHRTTTKEFFLKHAVRVSTAALDSLINGGTIEPPNYIKMDVEGAELRALNGARCCFERYRPVVFLATHGKQIHQECCRLLQSWDMPFNRWTRDQ